MDETITAPIGDLVNNKPKEINPKPTFHEGQVIILDDVVFRIRKITNKDIVIRKMPQEIQVAYLAKKVSDQANEINAEVGQSNLILPGNL